MRNLESHLASEEQPQQILPTVQPVTVEQMYHSLVELVRAKGSDHKQRPGSRYFNAIMRSIRDWCGPLIATGLRELTEGNSSLTGKFRDL